MTPTPDKGHAYHQGETDIIVAKLDLLIKKLGEESQQQIQAPIYAMGSHFMCEVCGNDGHSGNDCPETREDCGTSTTTMSIVHHKEATGGTSHVNVGVSYAQ